jgi:hypothetical protein
LHLLLADPAASLSVVGDYPGKVAAAADLTSVGRLRVGKAVIPARYSSTCRSHPNKEVIILPLTLH